MLFTNCRQTSSMKHHWLKQLSWPTSTFCFGCNTVEKKTPEKCCLACNAYGKDSKIIASFATLWLRDIADQPRDFNKRLSNTMPDRLQTTRCKRSSYCIFPMQQVKRKSSNRATLEDMVAPSLPAHLLCLTYYWLLVPNYSFQFTTGHILVIDYGMLWQSFVSCHTRDAECTKSYTLLTSQASSATRLIPTNRYNFVVPLAYHKKRLCAPEDRSIYRKPQSRSQLRTDNKCSSDCSDRSVNLLSIWVQTDRYDDNASQLRKVCNSWVWL